MAFYRLVIFSVWAVKDPDKIYSNQTNVSIDLTRHTDVNYGLIIKLI